MKELFKSFQPEVKTSKSVKLLKLESDTSELISYEISYEITYEVASEVWLRRLFRMKFRTKLPPIWYFGGHFVRNDLRSVTSYEISYEMIIEVSHSSFRIKRIQGYSHLKFCIKIWALLMQILRWEKSVLELMLTPLPPDDFKASAGVHPRNPFTWLFLGTFISKFKNWLNIWPDPQVDSLYRRDVTEKQHQTVNCMTGTMFYNRTLWQRVNCIAWKPCSNE